MSTAMAGNSPEPETVLRRGVAGPVNAGLLLLVAFLLLVPAIAESSVRTAGQAVLLWLASAFLTYAGLRYMVARVVLRSDEIVIVNLLRSYRLPWSDVESVVPPTRGAFARPAGVRTKAGRVIRCTGITPGRGEPLRVSDQWIAAIEGFLVASRHR